MKHFTKRQRHYIYKAMRYEPRVEEALCFALYDYLCSQYGFDFTDSILESESCPELYLFKRRNIDGYWLNNTDRLLVLAFCIVMTE